MEISIKVEAEDIAALVVALQERHCLDEVAKETMEMINQKANHRPPILYQTE